VLKKRRVKSLDEFLNAIAGLTDDRKWGRSLWFRGEDRTCYSPRLRPKLYRRPDESKRMPRMGRFLYADQELRMEFRRRAAQLFPDVAPEQKWEWYFLMQHFGVPTRLLDWTDGALVGLYFAVRSRNSADSKGDAAVYVLDPSWLNEKAMEARRLKYYYTGVALADWRQVQPYLPKEMESPRLNPELPVAIDPSHSSPRVAAQRSRFVIFGKDADGLISVAEPRDSRLCMIPVAGEEADAIRADLKISGISESTVFPDAEGLGRELQSYWFELCSPVQR
jgi:hypothetical protein